MAGQPTGRREHQYAVATSGLNGRFYSGRIALQLAPAASLRVAIVAPPFSLADWQVSLPADLSWKAFTWHELPNELAAEAWLTQS
jgi:hypothetical protein